MELIITQITIDSNLTAIVEKINATRWDDDNGIDGYSVDALTYYLDMPDTVFLVCHSATEAGNELLGMASARFEYKPYQKLKWMYVDEIDTSSEYRQLGVGTALMKKLLEIAKDGGCDELWLGAERVNSAANSFYVSLKPKSVEDVTGYTFKL